MYLNHRDVCTPYYGSVRSYLDLINYQYYSHDRHRDWFQYDKHLDTTKEQEQSTLPHTTFCHIPHSHPQFGCIYLDYCSRFSAGYTTIEKSPRGDLSALFRYGLLAEYVEMIICVHSAKHGGQGGEGKSRDRDSEEDADEDEEEKFDHLTLSVDVPVAIRQLAQRYGYRVKEQITPFRYRELEVHSAVLSKR
jgi:hypothetical protein